jgi:dienelactone hydrolase
LFHGGERTDEFGAPWPSGVPLQLHTMEGDPWIELDVCQALAAEVDGAELFVYPGSGHLFADTGSKDYEPYAARLLTERALTFLQRVG